ncbi:hypothetical protein P7H20_24875 [Paenibacillus larvae]|nr:hypothetical protein [Paenibacillus larvae]MDT2277421.1 hypothetical protein [Paenibacillus larvae]
MEKYPETTQYAHEIVQKTGPLTEEERKQEEARAQEKQVAYHYLF